MKQYVYSKVSAKTRCSEAHQSVNPDLRYWAIVALSTGDTMMTFADLSGYTLALSGVGFKLVDFGTFEYKMPLL